MSPGVSPTSTTSTTPRHGEVSGDPAHGDQSQGDLTPSPANAAGGISARASAWGLAAIMALAVAVRSLGWNFVFIDGEVLLHMWDGSYHARLALYSFVEFPRILFVDPYLRFPDGAPVPMPPLFDWMLAAVARCFGGDVGTFERVVAWSSPALAALAVLPTYFLARGFRGRGVGLGAALLVALIPASTQRSLLGDPDHHAAVALLLILTLAAGATLLRDDLDPQRRRAALLQLFLARTGMILVWSGSLLFLSIGEGAFLLGALLSRRPGLLTVQAHSSGLSALAIAPWVFAAPTPIGGPFTATTLSWLHPLALVVVAVAALLFGRLERSRPLQSGGATVARAVGVMVVVGALALCVPALREAASPAFAFLFKADTWGNRNFEQASLFASSTGGFGVGTTGTFGWWSYAIPLAPCAFFVASRVGLPAQVFLAVWSACLGVLTMSQIRFASDFAPIACVAIAVSLDQFRARLATRVPDRLAWLTCIAFGLALSWTTIYGSLSGQLKAAQWTRNLPDEIDPALFFGSAALVRFAETVRAHTPETSGYFDPRARPEYGILVKPSFGHVFSYVARRSTPATGFGPYLDQEKYQASLGFYGAKTREEALSIFDSLGTRYVVTRDHSGQTKGMFTHLLHRLDGSSRDGMQHTGEFRLVIEGPLGGIPLGSAFLRGHAQLVPYKLFERVPGVVLEARVPAGTAFAVELELETNVGRGFIFRARTTADAAGIARLRVPYATDTHNGTRALGPYRIEIGEDETVSVAVLESQIRAGAILEVTRGTAARHRSIH